MKIASIKPPERQYSIYYRANRVYRTESEWYFEDDSGKPYGPFASKDQTMQAVRIYKDVKTRGIQLPFDTIRRVI